MTMSEYPVRPQTMAALWSVTGLGMVAHIIGVELLEWDHSGISYWLVLAGLIAMGALETINYFG